MYSIMIYDNSHTLPDKNKFIKNINYLDYISNTKVGFVHSLIVKRVANIFIFIFGYRYSPHIIA